MPISAATAAASVRATWLAPCDESAPNSQMDIDSSATSAPIGASDCSMLGRRTLAPLSCGSLKPQILASR